MEIIRGLCSERSWNNCWPVCLSLRINWLRRLQRNDRPLLFVCADVLVIFWIRGVVWITASLLVPNMEAERTKIITTIKMDRKIFTLVICLFCSFGVTRSYDGKLEWFVGILCEKAIHDNNEKWEVKLWNCIHLQLTVNILW